MRLFITGMNGFIGSHLAAFFMERGHTIAGTARQAESARKLPSLRGCQVFPFSLGDTPPASMFEGCDTAIHCAHDFTRGSLELNVNATKALYGAAHSAGVARQVYVSSFSARPDAIAEYGRTKYLLEQFFLESGQTVIRPGLVIGGQGLFFRSVQAMLRSPIVPLLDSGRDLLPVIAVPDLLTAVLVIVERRGPGAYNLFHPEQISMRRILDTVRRAAGHKALYIPVNSTAAIFAIGALRKIGLRLPVDIDNLRALKQNQSTIHRTHLPELLPVMLGAEEAIGRYVAHRPGHPIGRPAR
jgi:nucleoside-diphosphate-sugar epimerase